jgi:hypothetical protein
LQQSVAPPSKARPKTRPQAKPQAQSKAKPKAAAVSEEEEGGSEEDYEVSNLKTMLGMAALKKPSPYNAAMRDRVVIANLDWSGPQRALRVAVPA